MKPATREWVAKVEEDYLAALDLSRRRKVPLWSSVCFHAQQSAEKYLKARLQEAGLRIPKTHDLEVVLNLLLGIEPLWLALTPASQRLTDFAVDFRYPGHDAQKSTCARSVKGCQNHPSGSSHFSRAASLKGWRAAHLGL